MIVRVLVGVMLMSTLAGASFTYAQSSEDTFERPLTLTMTPAYPAPGENVTLTIQSYSMDLDRSTVVWYRGNTEIARGEGKTSVSVTAGNRGSGMTIEVIAETNTKIRGTASATIRPTEVDLVWDTDSYVPPFFEGRALPGTNARVHAQAIARFERSNGTRIPDSDIIYTWYKGTTKIESGRGKSSVTFSGPALFGADPIRVVAESSDGTLRGEGRARIISADPTVELYENHPLFGILYHRALIAGARSSESEQEVVAVPYFAHVQSPADPSLVYTWEVNGRSLAADPKMPNAIIIKTDGYVGPAAIKLALTSANDLFLRAVGSWQILFSPATVDLFGGNPFGTSEN